MRLLLCLLALVAAPAWAEWVQVAVADVAVVYIDPATIRKDGNFRKVWELQNLKQRDKDGYLSRRTLWEYDCKEQRNRPISGSLHSETMAKGETIWSGDTPAAWGNISPNTVGKDIFFLICGSARADWVKVSESNQTVIYIDPTTIRKGGNIRRVWMLQDLKIRDKFGDMSRRSLDEFNCKEQKYRTLSLLAYAEPMASGKEIGFDYLPTDWRNIQPDKKNAASTTLKLLCAK
jgi:hypothetical protein